MNAGNVFRALTAQMSDVCYWCYVEMTELRPAADVISVYVRVAQLHIVSLLVNETQ